MALVEGLQECCHGALQVCREMGSYSLGVNVFPSGLGMFILKMTPVCDCDRNGHMSQAQCHDASVAEGTVLKGNVAQKGTSRKHT